MLCCVCFLLLIIRISYPYFIEPENIVIENLPLIKSRLDSAEQNKDFKTYSKNNYKSKAKLFSFDPNKVTESELLMLGFHEKAARTFIKYRNKGAVFKKKEDLKKVYSISPEMYIRLEPYIFIENKKNNDAINENKVQVETTPVRKTIELNSADSLTLLEINGIGPSFAKRILKYRSLLGGFVNKEQLKEVYGFTDEMYEKINSQIIVNTSLIKKINLNTDDFKSINKHPYLSYEHTKIIFDQRKAGQMNSGNIKNVLNDEETYNKILPYLSF